VSALRKPKETRRPRLAFTDIQSLEYSLLRLDIRAEAYLPLVLNMSMQNAYVEHLLNWERMVWVEFTGELPELTSNLS
jgi:hypothetical protein